ncbi:MAG: arylsulfatase [Pseudomonadota bacterium]
MHAQNQKPNIVLILADNLGWGELGCYGGGVLRGTETPRLDHLATLGLRLTNFNVESDCVPTRSALMTGRHPIRTGALQSLPAGVPQGLMRWERLLPEILNENGYATAHYGKWHLGDVPGRLPGDRGFDDWFGLPRTLNEAYFTEAVGFDSSAVSKPYLMEGKAGGSPQNLGVFDMEARRLIDAEVVSRSRRFIQEQAKAGRPFFLYAPMTQVHFPCLAHPDFMGRTGFGEMADSLAELDFRAGEIFDELDRLNLADNTLVIFASDNGPEFRDPWRGTAGYWRGTYHTAMEGGLRSPAIFRWPGNIPEGAVSDEIMHIADLYTTLISIAGCAQSIPDDRPIDGIDQSGFLRQQSTSNREGFLFYIKQELRAAKWRDWKYHYYWEPEVNQGIGKLESPMLFNLIQDPKEETNCLVEQSWVLGPIAKMVQAFNQSLELHPPIKPGTPDQV